MSFDLLPSDCWNLICSFLNAKEKIRLILVGNFHLSEKLCNGGITELDFDLHKHNLPSKLLSRLITINTLKIQCYFNSFSNLHSNHIVDFECWSPKLARLEIDMFLNQKSLSSLPSSITHLSACIADDDLESIPYDLLHLHIHNPLKSKTPRMPSKLLTLQANLSSPYQVPILPEGLQNLTISVQIIDKKLVKSFPRSLDSLSLVCERIVDFDCIAALPTKLTYLNLPLVSHFNGSYLKDLPPFLLTLKIPNDVQIADEHVHLLPQHLTSLDLNSSVNITESGITHLPKSITDLKLSIIDFSHVKHTDWPTKLKTLEVFTSGSSRFLPRPKILFSDIPRTLTEIISSQWFFFDMEDADIAQLPRSLTKLNFGTNYNLTKNCITHLPHSLVILEIDQPSIHFDDSVVELFPRTLRVLSLAANNLISDKAAKHFPINLESLRMPNNQLITCDGVEVLIGFQAYDKDGHRRPFLRLRELILSHLGNVPNNYFGVVSFESNINSSRNKHS